MQCPYIIKHNHPKPSAWGARDAMIGCPSIPPAHDWLEGIDGQVSGMPQHGEQAASSRGWQLSMPEWCAHDEMLGQPTWWREMASLASYNG